MTRRLRRGNLAVLVGVCLLTASARAADQSAAREPTPAIARSSIVLLPPRLTLMVPAGAERIWAGQQLLVERVAGGRHTGDVTRQATFRSSNPQVAIVTRSGTVRPVAAGRATVTAAVGGATARVPVEVQTVAPDQRLRREAPSFRNHVEPVLTKMGCNSGACHGALAGKGGLKLTLRGYDPESDHAVLTRQVGGRRVSMLEPERSLLLQKPTAGVPHGGGQRFPVSSVEYQVLGRWIAAGAPPPRPDDARMVRLELFPEQATLRQGDAQQILVRAWFSDGRQQDVTRWVKFGTSDSGVAEVDEEGRVRVQGPGEAAVTVWYLSQVAFSRVVSPYGGGRREASGVRNGAPMFTPDASRLPPGTPPASFIDALVDKKLRELNIPASGTATDGEFIRRAHLDAAGLLPTAAEVEAFLKSAPQGGSPAARRARRARLIDRLLERPEYVDLWTYKWSDLLLVSTRGLSPLSMRAFHRWIRESVAEDKSWDRFAREIITASGSTQENGAANYYALHRDPIDLTETTTQAFLGMSLTCARCHNHPLEKWTQNQYYALANLFARVSRKDGDRGDLVVFAADSGNIRHPRTGRALPPQPLDAPAIPLDASGDRREHLADWLTSPKNPYFARALVNRVWRQFMGRGLVEPEDDLRLTNPASNEELLAALTADFTKHGFRVKRLIRTIMTSEAYQRSAQPHAGNETDQKYYSHYIIRRLPAEVMLDALSQVTGIPTEFPGYPKGWRALQLPDSSVESYFLTAFGRPPRVTTCSCERQQEPSVTQALHLVNGDAVNKKLQAADGLVAKLVADRAPDEEVLRRVYLAALSRLPTTKERPALLQALATAPPGDTPALQTARRQVLEDLCWAVLTSREFLFNH